MGGFKKTFFNDIIGNLQKYKEVFSHGKEIDDKCKDLSKY